VDGVRPWPVVVAFLAACHSVKPLALPRVGTEVPWEVPLDLLVEIELFTRSDCGLLPGCPGPYRPEQVEAECVPAERCRVLVSDRMDNPHTILSVAGVSMGPAEVKLRYKQPQSDEWLNAQLALRFGPEEKLPTLALGYSVPKGAVRLERLGPGLQKAGFHAPARCEPTDEFRSSFVCFGLDGSTGMPRFPSCASTPRCKVADEPPHDGFTVDLKWLDKAIAVIEYRASRDGVHEVVEREQSVSEGEDHGR